MTGVASVTRHFEAAAERVFDAWLNPKLLGQWMFGVVVQDEEVLGIRVDGRVGGTFSFLVRRGENEIDHVGEYLEIDRPHRLAFTWGIAGGDLSRVVIEIVPAGSGCELTLTHEMHPDWADFASRAEGSWKLMLDALAQVV